MRSTRRWLRVSILFVLLPLLMGQDKCPDYGKPDDTGPLPAGTPATVHKYSETARRSNPPDPLTCDVAVYQTISLSQQGVNCDAAAVNYSALFTQAKAIADGIAAATQCPAGCQPIHSWIERLETTCQGGTAGIILDIGLLCPRNAARPPGVQIAANDPRLNGQPITLPAPQPPNPAPPRQPSIGDVEGQLASTAVACGPPPEPIEYRYREATPCGGAGFNFQPYVRRAERRAGAGCRAITCAAGCTPCTPPVNLRSRWRCRNANEVEVTVHVQCCK